MTGSNNLVVATVQKNWAQIQKILSGKSVTVVGVTKFQPPEIIRAAVEMGVTCLGNNYAQDGDALMAEVANVEWHFIGHIQSRKVKYLVNYHTIESLDRFEIAELLNQRLKPLDRKVEVYVEVNIGNEPQKSGVFVNALPVFLKSLAPLSQLSVTGLMCIPPPLEPVEKRAPFFKAAKELFDRFRHDYPLRHLSMGTSQDYALAVSEGATTVRLGTTLFGDRPK